jgi:thiosulfate dehydrogenase [quinone] large subunit
LGVTFLFAGLQKLANPKFFDASNPASIQSQLAGAARRSPVHALVSPLVHVAVPLGVLIALGEVAVGLGALLGLWTRVAAAGGALLSFMLFLTVSFHSSPYYTGSDIVFLFAWLPLLLAGSGDVLSADWLIANRVRRKMGAEAQSVVPIPFSAVRRMCGAYDAGSCKARDGEPCEPAPCPFLLQRPGRAKRLAVAEIDRRTFTARGAAAGAVAAAGLIGTGAVVALARLVGGTAGSRSAPSLGTAAGASSRTPPSSAATSVAPSSTSVPPTPSTSAPASAATAPPTTPTTAAPRPAGVRIGPARDVPVGSAASFQDPKSGDPALVVQPRAGTFLAFDAVCPHAGCSVEYDSSARLFVCPCHGSEFNGSTGAVEIGPAVTGLSKINIAEGPDGELYVT